ncbi:MAG: hypothetical protein JOZ81_08250 [Chloroflexi bacterium]|nr:hypothetical protein [Chloroflexota bacterium]
MAQGTYQSSSLSPGQQRVADLNRELDGERACLVKGAWWLASGELLDYRPLLARRDYDYEYVGTVLFFGGKDAWLAQIDGNRCPPDEWIASAWLRETTKAAREAFNTRFLDQVDSKRELPEAERNRRAIALRKAYFQRLSLKGQAARRAEAKRRQAATSVDPPATGAGAP